MEFPESKYIDTAVAVFFSFPERTWLHFVSLSKSLYFYFLMASGLMFSREKVGLLHIFINAKIIQFYCSKKLHRFAM